MRLHSSAIEAEELGDLGDRTLLEMFQDEDDPLSARIRCEWKIGVSRGAWRTRIETTSVMTADARDFRITNVLDAYEGETRIFSRANLDVVPRDLV